MSFNSHLALGKILLFLFVEQSPNLCLLASLLSRSPRSVPNRSPRSVGHWRRRQTDRQVFSLRVMALFSVSFTQRILECGDIVLGVRGKPFVWEERRRFHEVCVGLDRSLLEVVGVGLITCGEVELLSAGAVDHSLVPIEKTVRTWYFWSFFFAQLE